MKKLKNIKIIFFSCFWIFIRKYLKIARFFEVLAGGLWNQLIQAEKFIIINKVNLYLIKKKLKYQEISFLLNIFLIENFVLFTNFSNIFIIIFSAIKLDILILKEVKYNLNIHVIIEKGESMLFSKRNNKNNEKF